MEAKWYTVRVATNKERFVNEKITQEFGRRDVGFQTLLPIEKTFFLKAGKKSFRDKVIYPGYLFVKANNLEILQDCLKMVPGNAGILKNRHGEPAVLKEQEVQKMIVDNEKAATIDHNTFVVDEIVSIIGGPFDKFQGTIEEINQDKSKVKVNVSIFGRPTPVDLSLDQIQKVLI